MIDRIASTKMQNSTKSALILGPRQTGKSTLVKSLRPDLSINFADQEVYLKHSQNFSLLRSLIERRKAKTVFIDEVQRIPDILNTVQALIDENPKIKFYLTGSSARKLKKGGANLLPGRVINYSLGALTLKEINYEVKKTDFQYGFLPGIYLEKENEAKEAILASYSANYISEEIKAEALVRDLPSFSRFLQHSSFMLGKFIDYSKMAQAIKVSRHQIPKYFEIFEDTMIGYRLFPHTEWLDKYDLIKHPKFFFFDVGVYNGLQNSFSAPADRMGALAEQVVYQQLLHSGMALQKKINIHSLRTRGGAEIDFLVEMNSRFAGIEVKASSKVIEDDVQHLARFKKLEPTADYYLLHLGKDEIKLNGIWCLPLGVGFKEIGF